MTAEIRHDDCLALMREMPDASVAAVVTDPPYGLTFMGKAWDHGVPGVDYWAEALRVTAPGRYLLAFGGTRTYHRLACAIEDAGWEIHDCLSWLYGSGFPKHKSKLKPAWEPVVLARRPAKNATPLNVDACRIGDEALPAQMAGQARLGAFERRDMLTPARSGRWPANVMLDEDAAAMLDAQAPAVGASMGAGVTAQTYTRCNRVYGKDTKAHTVFGIDGLAGASRFFYCAKATREEREAGTDGMPLRTLAMSHGAQAREASGETGRRHADEIGLNVSRAVRNHHPTVKPIALMRWLVRLVTPQGGTVLDPFAGSGSTGVAAVLEGRAFIGMEREAEYVEIARARIASADAQASLALETA